MMVERGKKLTVEGELAALVEETKTLRAGPAADEVGEETTQKTTVTGDSITTVCCLVTA
jgi:hypothetical protein